MFHWQNYDALYGSKKQILLAQQPFVLVLVYLTHLHNLYVRTCTYILQLPAIVQILSATVYKMLTFNIHIIEWWSVA